MLSDSSFRTRAVTVVIPKLHTWWSGTRGLPRTFPARVSLLIRLGLCLTFPPVASGPQGGPWGPARGQRALTVLWLPAPAPAPSVGALSHVQVWKTEARP